MFYLSGFYYINVIDIATYYISYPSKSRNIYCVSFIDSHRHLSTNSGKVLQWTGLFSLTIFQFYSHIVWWSSRWMRRKAWRGRGYIEVIHWVYILQKMLIIVLGPLHLLGPHILVESTTIFNCGNVLVFGWHLLESLPKTQRKSDGIPFKVFPSLVYLFLTITTFFCIIARDHLKIVVYQFEYFVGSNPNLLSINNIFL